MGAQAETKMNKICLENELRNITKQMFEKARWHDDCGWIYTEDDLVDEMVSRVVEEIDNLKIQREGRQCHLFTRNLHLKNISAAHRSRMDRSLL